MNPPSTEVNGARAPASPAGIPAQAPRFLVFGLDDLAYGLPLARVERVVRVVAFTPLPKAPAIILGVINLQGRIIAVADLRARLRLPPRFILTGDQLIIAHTGQRPLALWVDRVGDILTPAAAAITPPAAILPGLGHVAGVVRLPDGTLLIHDLDRFFSLEEAAQLDAAAPPSPDPAHALTAG